MPRARRRSVTRERARVSGIYGSTVARPPAPSVRVAYSLRHRGVPAVRGVTPVYVDVLAVADQVHCRVVEAALDPLAVREVLEETCQGMRQRRVMTPLLLCGQVPVELVRLVFQSRVPILAQPLETVGAIELLAVEAARRAREHVRYDPSACLPWASGPLARWVGAGLGPANLSPKQETIVALYALGLRRVEIAEMLDMRIKRVDSHIGEVLSRTRQQFLEDVAKPFAARLADNDWEPEAGAGLSALRTPPGGVASPRMVAMVSRTRWPTERRSTTSSTSGLHGTPPTSMRSGGVRMRASIFSGVMLTTMATLTRSATTL